MKAALQKTFDALCSLGLACALLVLLGLLTWLGTLEQVDHGLFEVQKKYFESYLLWHDFGPVSIPLPGANLVMSVLFVNLVLGGIVRLRKGWSTIGILVTHIGILLMLAAGFVKNYFSVEGHVSLFDGQTAQSYQSFYRWELAVLEDLGEGKLIERVVPNELVESAQGTQGAVFSAPDLPFSLAVTHFLPNCEPLPKGPMFDVTVPVIDGIFLKQLPKEKQAEANYAGAYVAIFARDGGRQEGIVWGAERGPWTFSAGGKRYGVTLRRERYDLPFALRLDKFTKEDHARTTMAKSFSSDVTVREASGDRRVHISMNAPLRDKGLVIYQASYGPGNAKPGDPLYSTLQVVQNPADQLPLYACLIIAAGLILHFSRKLVQHVRAQRRER